MISTASDGLGRIAVWLYLCVQQQARTAPIAVVAEAGAYAGDEKQKRKKEKEYMWTIATWTWILGSLYNIARIDRLLHTREYMRQGIGSLLAAYVSS